VDGVAEKMISELNLKTEGTHYNGSSHAGHFHGSTSSNNGAYVSKESVFLLLELPSAFAYACHIVVMPMDQKLAKLSTT